MSFPEVSLRFPCPVPAASGAPSPRGRGGGSRDEQSPVPGRTPQPRLRGRFCVPGLCFHGSLPGSIPRGWPGSRMGCRAGHRARLGLLGHLGMENVGKEQNLGLPLQSFTSIQLPNCCFSPLLVGLQPPAHPSSLLCPTGHGGAVSASMTQNIGANTAASP